MYVFNFIMGNTLVCYRRSLRVCITYRWGKWCLCLNYQHDLMLIIVYKNNSVVSHLSFYCSIVFLNAHYYLRICTLTEPYDYLTWCLILLFFVHVSGAAIFVVEWLSPLGLDKGNKPIRGESVSVAGLMCVNCSVTQSFPQHSDIRRIGRQYCKQNKKRFLKRFFLFKI